MLQYTLDKILLDYLSCIVMNDKATTDCLKMLMSSNRIVQFLQSQPKINHYWVGIQQIKLHLHENQNRLFGIKYV